MKKKTLQDYMSRYRTMRKRLLNLPLSHTSEIITDIKVKGQNLVIKGKSYTPKELEALSKKSGRESLFSMDAIKHVETKLKELEYKYVKEYDKVPRDTILRSEELDAAKAGITPVSEEDVEGFRSWLEESEPGESKNYRKYLFYHVYGATYISSVTVAGFKEWYKDWVDAEVAKIEDYVARSAS